MLGIKLSEIEEGANITLNISNDDGDMKMDAVIKKHIQSNISLIEPLYSDVKRLNFDNVQINVEYCQANDMPILWRSAKITTYKTGYVLQVPTDGVRHNRRAYFRVAVAHPARLHTATRSFSNIMVRDISLGGFAIADRKNELQLSVGDLLSVTLEDLGFQLGLDGRVVRTEEREDMTIYGLVICNMCKDLSAYLSIKQRRNKKAEG